MGETIFTEEEVRQRLRDLIRYDRSQTDIAKEVGLSAAYVSSVLKGKDRPAAKLARLVGMEPVRGFRMIKGDDDD